MTAHPRQKEELAIHPARFDLLGAPPGNVASPIQSDVRIDRQQEHHK